jgi:Tol biopolymer transport system component
VIAFRQQGELGGIHIVPALGGKSVLVAPGGFRPRFSPDGTRLAYWTGERNFRTAKVFVVPRSGGDPVQVAPELSYAAYPIWSPDGTHVLFVGAQQMLTGQPNTDDWEWWVAPVDGGPPIKTSVRKQLREHGLRAPEAGWAHRWTLPYAWTSSGHIVFSARSGNQTNIWKLPISARNWELRGPAEQLTFGAGRQDHPSIASNGALVFTALNQKSDVWTIPIDEKTRGTDPAMRKLTSGPADSNRPSVSRDGRRLAFVSNRTGSDQVWVKELPDGRELALTATPEEKDAVVMSPDGSRVAFGYAPPLPEAILVLPFAGGKASRLCSDCGLPRTWMPDGTALLYQRLAAPESLIGVVGPGGSTAALLRAAGSALFSPSVSADGEWLALIVRNPPNDHQVMLLPLRDGKAEERTAWIPATEPGAWVDKPRWSATGHTVYYVSDRDGFVCIWAQRFDPAVRKLRGAPRDVAHFHSGRVSLGAVFGLDLSVAEDKLVFNLGEASGNIWLAPAAP